MTTHTQRSLMESGHTAAVSWVSYVRLQRVVVRVLVRPRQEEHDHEQQGQQQRGEDLEVAVPVR